MEEWASISCRILLVRSSSSCYRTSSSFRPSVSFCVSGAVKSEEEIKLIRKAAQIVDSGISRGLHSLRPGVTEQEVFAKIVETTMRLGSEGVPFSAIVSSGKKALKDELAGDREMRKGDFVAMDVGAMFHGYVGDAARTGAVREAGQNMVWTCTGTSGRRSCQA